MFPITQQPVHPPPLLSVIYRQLPCLSFLASWFENEHTAECNLLLWSELIMAADSVLYYERRCLLTESCWGKSSNRTSAWAVLTRPRMQRSRCTHESRKKKRLSNRENSGDPVGWAWIQSLSLSGLFNMHLSGLQNNEDNDDNDDEMDYFSIFSLLQQL